MKSAISFRAVMLTTAYFGLFVLFHAAEAVASSCTQPTVRWEQCPEASPPAPSTLECGYIDVPMNYKDPQGSTITLAVTRLKANGSRKVRSGLFLENGGPGAANAETVYTYAVNAASGKSNGPANDAIAQVYDFVGLDMRGTGASMPPLKCNGQLYDELIYPSITKQDTYNETVQRAGAWARSCINMTGPMINHMGTDQAVQDFELTRQALGYAKFNYLGFSYGTKIGHDYAQKYPQTVGKMVLDGLTNQQLPAEDMWMSTALGLDVTFNAFFDWCNQTTECALHGRDQKAIFNTVAEWTRKGELKNATCLQQHCDEASTNSTLDYARFIFAAELSLHDGTRPHLPQNWQNASAALNRTYVEMSDAYYGETPWFKKQPAALQPSYGELVIQCSDRRQRQLSFADFRNLYTLMAAIAPISQGHGIQGRVNGVCSGWPLVASNPPPPVDLKQMRQLPPVMLVNAFFDPATPSSLGIGLRPQMPTAFSVYRNGGGHTSFPHQGETAMAVARFLINGTIPADGTVYET